MHRLIGTIGVCATLVLALGSTALAFDSPQKYGVELRGGFGMYDMGDIVPGVKNMQTSLGRKGISNSLSTSDAGPSGGLSFLYRPSKHAQWEVGYNALLDVVNSVDTNPDTASGEIVMHGGELFLKGVGVATLTDRILLHLGAGLAMYNCRLQVQDNYEGRYNYHASGKAFGLIAAGGIEVLPLPRFGIHLEGGARVANISRFSYESTPGTRTNLPVINGTRPMELNLSGVYGTLGLRFYFDKVTKPVDFSR